MAWLRRIKMGTLPQKREKLQNTPESQRSCRLWLNFKVAIFHNNIVVNEFNVTEIYYRIKPTSNYDPNFAIPCSQI